MSLQLFMMTLLAPMVLLAIHGMFFSMSMLGSACAKTKCGSFIAGSPVRNWNALAYHQQGLFEPGENHLQPVIQIVDAATAKHPSSSHQTPYIAAGAVKNFHSMEQALMKPIRPLQAMRAPRRNEWSVAGPGVRGS